MGMAHFDGHNQKIHASGTAAPHIEKRHARSHAETGVEGRHEGAAGVGRRQGKDQVQDNGGNNHAPGGL